MHRRQHLGMAGEDLAAAHLTRTGLQVVARNWRASTEGVRGELDLIALEGPTLAIVEVKTRSSTHAGGAVAAVGWDKRRRLRRLAGLYLAANPHSGPVRGDVVTVDRDQVGGSADGPVWSVRHLRGVW